jgi:hypothetical protein
MVWWDAEAFLVVGFICLWAVVGAMGVLQLRV